MYLSGKFGGLPQYNDKNNNQISLPKKEITITLANLELR